MVIPCVLLVIGTTTYRISHYWLTFVFLMLFYFPKHSYFILQWWSSHAFCSCSVSLPLDLVIVSCPPMPIGWFSFSHLCIYVHFFIILFSMLRFHALFYFINFSLLPYSLGFLLLYPTTCGSLKLFYSNFVYVDKFNQYIILNSTQPCCQKHMSEGNICHCGHHFPYVRVPKHH